MTASAEAQHTQYGLTIKRIHGVASFISENDELLPLPTLPFSPDAERLRHTVPPLVDHAPAVPAIQQSIEGAESRGEALLASLLARAGAAAKEQALSSRKTEGNPAKQRTKKTSSETIRQLHEASYSAPLILTTEDDKVSDAVFIQKTMDGDYHRDEAKRLFYANNGQAYLDRGLLYAAAFEMMRKDCIQRVAGKRMTTVAAINIVSPPSRPIEHKIYVAGVPTMEELIARADPETAYRRRREAYKWAGIRHRV